MNAIHTEQTEMRHQKHKEEKTNYKQQSNMNRNH